MDGRRKKRKISDPKERKDKKSKNQKKEIILDEDVRILMKTAEDVSKESEDVEKIASHRDTLRWFTSFFNLLPKWPAYAMNVALDLSANDAQTLYDATRYVYRDFLIYHVHFLQIDRRYLLSSLKNHEKRSGVDLKDDEPSLSDANALKMEKTRKNYYEAFDFIVDKRAVYEKIVSLYESVFWMRCSHVRIDCEDRESDNMIVSYRLDPDATIDNPDQDRVVVEKIGSFYEEEESRSNRTGDAEKDAYKNDGYFKTLSKLIFRTNVHVRMALHKSEYREDHVVFVEWVDKTLEMMLYYYIMLKCGCAVAYVLKDDRVSVADAITLLYDVFGTTPEEQVFLFYSWYAQYKKNVCDKSDVVVVSQERSQTNHVFAVADLENANATTSKRSYKNERGILNEIALPPSHGDDRLDSIVTDLILSDEANSKMRFINLCVAHHLEEHVEKRQVRCANYYIYRNKKEKKKEESIDRSQQQQRRETIETMAEEEDGSDYDSLLDVSSYSEDDENETSSSSDRFLKKRTKEEEEDDNDDDDDESKKDGDMSYNFCVTFSELCEVLHRVECMLDYDFLKKTNQKFKQFKSKLNGFDFDDVRTNVDQDERAYFDNASERAKKRARDRRNDAVDQKMREVSASRGGRDVKDYNNVPDVIKRQLNEREIETLFGFKDTEYLDDSVQSSSFKSSSADGRSENTRTFMIVNFFCSLFFRERETKDHRRKTFGIFVGNRNVEYRLFDRFQIHHLGHLVRRGQQTRVQRKKELARREKNDEALRRPRTRKRVELRQGNHR